MAMHLSLKVRLCTWNMEDLGIMGYGNFFQAIHCTVGEQKVLSVKISFSLKFLGHSSFCRENRTDDVTNQFLAKF